MKNKYLVLIATGVWYNAFISGMAVMFEHIEKPDLGWAVVFAIFPMSVAFVFFFSVFNSDNKSHDKAESDPLVPDPEGRKCESNIPELK